MVMMAEQPENDALHAAQDEIAELFGGIADFWGFTRTQGRIFGLLFLSPTPLGHAEIRDRLGISAGSASMTLASLSRWGVVRRRDRLYAAETDFWKMITGVFRRREQAQVDQAIAVVEGALQRLHAAPTEPGIKFATRRLQRLLDFFKLGRSFLEAFVTRSPVGGLINSIAQRAAKFPAMLRTLEDHVRFD